MAAVDESAEKPVSVTKGAEPAPALRASDADRDRTADILREALAEGRLTAEEHAERIGAVYRARTHAELEPLVRDLPKGRRPAPGGPLPYPYPVPSAATENLVAVFGGAARKGRWRVGPRTNAFALFGEVEIDLSEALFTQREIVINATAVFGGVDIKVPENVSVRSAGTGVFGGFDVRTHEADEPDAPVVLVTGFALFGAVKARARRGKRVRNLLARA
ncbi:DUF1707 domain-containing protein [Streptomyces sp. QH1-20]|uniref:DUF1707 SHOCT-like domain-containing protein n=1 Tax=Streptomyces sp. QH1-20 TaxID=3240934 RepID=UPI003515BE48